MLLVTWFQGGRFAQFPIIFKGIPSSEIKIFYRQRHRGNISSSYLTKRLTYLKIEKFCDNFYSLKIGVFVIDFVPSDAPY